MEITKAEALAIVAEYNGIVEMEREAGRRRDRVADLAQTGWIDRAVLASLLGITESGLVQIVQRRGKSGAYRNLGSNLITKKN